MLCSICRLTCIDLAGGEVAVAAVDGLELAAVDGDDGVREQLEVAAQANEAAADIADADAVVVAEVGDGLEVRRQPAGEPHQFDVALRLALQAAARLDAIQIAVDVELQQDRRVVRRATGGCRFNAVEPQCMEIEFFDERINDSYRVVFADIVVKALWQQSDLLSVLAFNESLHGQPPRSDGLAQYRRPPTEFPHNLGQDRTVGVLSEFAKTRLRSMYEHTWLREQTRATRALVKFISDHQGQPDADLGFCLAALEAKNIEQAVHHARRVKPTGMGGITDWFPPVICANENEEYVTEVLVALVNHWARLISLSFKASAG